MGQTACTEPQCLYKGALYLYLYCITHGDVLLYFLMVNDSIAWYKITQRNSSPICYLDYGQDHTGRGLISDTASTAVLWLA